jgi:hypothetical protein
MLRRYKIYSRHQGVSVRLRIGAAAIVIAVPAAILLAACGSSSPPVSPSPGGTTAGPSAAAASSAPTAGSTTATLANGDFNSCSVVTQAEAASAIGESVTAGVLGSATVEGGLACVFYGPSAPTPRDPNVAQADSVRVVVVEGPDALTWYNDYKSKVNAKTLSGYGDQAYWDGYASLSVLKGTSYLRIAVSPGLDPPSLSDEEQLAKAILPGL